MRLLFLIIWPMLSACAAFFAGRRRESLAWTISFAAAAAELAAALLTAFGPAPASVTVPFLCNLGIFLEYDGFRCIYTVIIAFMWLITLAFSRDYFRGHHKLVRYDFFMMMTLGATMGVFLSGDLYTALIFFEIMSFTSYPWVIQEETPAAIRAANTYLAVAVIGGLTAMMGLFLLQHELGTTALSALGGALRTAEHPALIYTAGGCILFGFGAKAGMFPLHIWLPKAHPVAPAPASALLSGILTKSGIWGILALTSYVFAGDPHWGAVILGLGCVTMLLGAVMALFSVDLKKTLACSSLSQIGFILVGIGMMGLLGEENALAAQGTLLHMLNHSLFKLVLFLCAGAIYMDAHTLDLTALKGFGRDKPFLMICFLLGAAGIAGIPGLNGYISKTLLHESIVEGQASYGPGLIVAEWVFLISGGLTLAYMTKLFVCLFVEKAQKKPAACTMRPLSYAAIGVSALLLPLLGLTAGRSMNALAALGTDFFRSGKLHEAVSYYSLTNLKGGLISILIGALLYLFAVRRFMIAGGVYVDRWPARLDLEEGLYRPLLLKWLPGLCGAVSRLFAENVLTGGIFRALVRFADILAHALSDTVDAAVLLLRRTVFVPLGAPDTDKVHHSLSYRLGTLADRARRRRQGGEQSHERAQLYYRTVHTFLQTTHDLADSVSFALLLLAGAICVILIYVLVLRN